MQSEQERDREAEWNYLERSPNTILLAIDGLY